MEWIVKTLQNSPKLAILLMLAPGFAVDQTKVKGFGLGTVSGVLPAGVLAGQLDISVSLTVKSTFFLLSLPAAGYSVEPQFVRGLKKTAFRSRKYPPHYPGSRYRVTNELKLYSNEQTTQTNHIAHP